MVTAEVVALKSSTPRVYRRFKVLSGDEHLGWIHRETEADAMAVAKQVFKVPEIRLETSE